MEAQTVREPFGYGSHHLLPNFCNRVRSNARNQALQTSSSRRGVKREAVDDHKTGLYIPKSEVALASCSNGVSMYPSTQGIKHKPRLCGSSIEPPDCYSSWIRDEPYNSCVPFLESSYAAAERNSSTEIATSHGAVDGASPSGCTASVVMDDRKKALAAELLAQLKATTVKEEVLRKCIERHGGGQAGLRAVVSAILFWVQMRNSRNRSKSSDSCTTQACSPGQTDGSEQISWPNLDTESIVDAVISLSRNAKNLKHASSITGTVAGLAQSPSSRGSDVSSPSELRTADSGSGEYSRSPAGESQPAGMGGPGPVGGLSGGLEAQGSGHQFWKTMQSDQWLSQVRDVGHEKAEGAKLTRQQSPSADGIGGNGGSSDLYGYDGALRQNSKILRQSRATSEHASPAQSSNEFQPYFNAATAEGLGAQGIFSEANSFGHFNASSSGFPIDPQCMDFNAFADAQGLQGHAFVNDNMGLESSIHGCGLDRYGSLRRSSDRKPSITRLGVKTSPAACTRLARKQRLDRNRKAVNQVNRGSFEHISPLADKAVGGTCTPGFSKNASRSQGTQTPDGRISKTVDRRHQENLQFLLMKVLRPSDVGNLGRIVLPKKDAECHLPWLSAREGIQLPCEDYDTGEHMVLRYRFWPNNKSRMYLLESTGDFVKRHQLQESDRMLLYRNPVNGIYVVCARKAQDCKAQDALESLPKPGQLDKVVEETEAEAMEITVQDSPEGPCSSGTSSQSIESAVGLSQDGVSESSVPGSRVVISRDDLLNFADLPDAPMGVTDHLVRFPSLESFDVELLELGCLQGKEEDVTSCIVKIEAKDV